ncbi:MAG: hypothetical protein ABSB76_01660 [Streptosporangiaceae bacterium]|jgi:hypothetical protein
MHVEPGQQAGDGKDPVHGAVWSGQGETAALGSDVLAQPDKHGEAGAVNVGKASEVGDIAEARLTPPIAEVCLQRRRTAEIQFTPQADHGHTVVIAG